MATEQSTNQPKSPANQDPCMDHLARLTADVFRTARPADKETPPSPEPRKAPELFPWPNWVRVVTMPDNEFDPPYTWSPAEEDGYIVVTAPCKSCHGQFSIEGMAARFCPNCGAPMNHEDATTVPRGGSSHADAQLRSTDYSSPEEIKRRAKSLFGFLESNEELSAAEKVRVYDDFLELLASCHSADEAAA